MRRKFLVAFLGVAGLLVVAGGLAVLVSGGDDESAATGIVVAIPDNPADQDNVVAIAPPVEPEPEPEAPPPAEEVFITEAIKERLRDPALREGATPEDVAAAETFYGARSGPALWVTSAGISESGQAALGALSRSADWGLDPAMFRVPPADYVPTNADEQAATEAAISLAILKYARAARGGLSDPAALSKIYTQTPSLHDPATVLADAARSSEPQSFMQGLHPKHDQFQRLQKALAKATSEADKARLSKNMERWRWMPETLGATYVWVNIPEFNLHVVEDGKPVQSEKVVVGNSKTPTPVLSADLKTIVFNPERVVPLSIIRRDVLPKLTSGGFFGGNNAADILKQYKLTVKRGGRVVDPGSIDWKKVNVGTLTFVQAPGGTNLLGKVQFLFPNDENVYMSDTTLRGQLARDVRAEGGEDPRVDNPVAVAARLLEEDKGWTDAKVKQLVASGRTNPVTIDKSIPVHITYFTAIVDDQGGVTTFDDVYGLDKLESSDATRAPGDGANAAPLAGSTPLPARRPLQGSLAGAAR